MWIYVLLLFLLAKATAGETDCSGSPFELCPYPKIFTTIPKTAYEYGKLCKDLPNYIKCVREFQQSCGGVVFFDSDEEYESIHDFYSELCEEGSFLNTIVIENLKCLNETFGSSLCPAETRGLLNEFKTFDTPNGDSEDLPLDLECLKSISEAACMTADLSKKCGSVVKETAYDVIRRSNFIESSCPTDWANRLLNEPKVVDLQMKYQDFFYNVMGIYTDDDLGSGFL